jgi:NADH:ubiquinone oxidoreductase subunit F (NADH-binding)
MTAATTATVARSAPASPDSRASFTPRLLAGDLTRRETLSAYLAAGGYDQTAWRSAPDELRALLSASELRGRGGSAFPVGRKWESVAAQPGRRVVLINGAESEPASWKDRLLLERRPHLVVEGALLAAQATGADECVWYLHEGQRTCRTALEAALAELRAAGWRLPDWRVVEAPARYVSGEETAAVRHVNGGPALPSFKPPRPFERGVRNRPTLVQNVETLANVPLIASRGAQWFRAIGAASLPGSQVLTLSGCVAQPGVVEAPSGLRLDDIISTYGGGTDDGYPVQAVLPGGYFAGWVSGAALRAGVRLERESLAAVGAMPGAGAISVVSDEVCGLWQATRLLRFFADESARQCGTCTHGTQAMADALERIARGQAAPNDLKRLASWANHTLPGRGACGHLDGAATAARTTLTVFKDEIERHLRHGGCGRPTASVLPGL